MLMVNVFFLYTVITTGTASAAFFSALCPGTARSSRRDLSFVSSSATARRNFGEESLTRVCSLPKSKPLNEYATPTAEFPLYGYKLANTDSRFYQAKTIDYIVGAPIDELFELTSDFTEKSIFWGNLFEKFENPSYRSGDPNGVGNVREFIWSTGDGDGRHYIEQLSYCDPEKHTFMYTMDASRDVGFLFNSMLTYCTFVDEPDKKRVKVTFYTLIGLTTIGRFLWPFVIKKGQETARTSVIKSMQSFFPMTK